jgi:hypothetical protein
MALKITLERSGMSSAIVWHEFIGKSSPCSQSRRPFGTTFGDRLSRPVSSVILTTISEHSERICRSQTFRKDLSSLLCEVLVREFLGHLLLLSRLARLEKPAKRPTVHCIAAATLRSIIFTASIAAAAIDAVAVLSTYIQGLNPSIESPAIKTRDFRRIFDPTSRLCSTKHKRNSSSCSANLLMNAISLPARRRPIQ